MRGLSGEQVTAPIVQSFYHGPTNTWTHVVADPDSPAAAIVDPVLDFEPASGRIWPEQARIVLDWVQARRLRVDWIVETHAHADHLTGADWLKRRLGAAGNAPSTKLRTALRLSKGREPRQP